MKTHRKKWAVTLSFVILSFLTLASYIYVYKKAELVEQKWRYGPESDVGQSIPGTSAAKLVTTQVHPTAITKVSQNRYIVDFGKVAFGTIQFNFEQNITAPISIRLSERLKSNSEVWTRKRSNSIEHENVAYFEKTINIGKYDRTLMLPERIRPSKTQLPPGITGVIPFRYAEVENPPEPVTKKNLQQLMVHSEFNDNASEFSSSDKVLNDIWEFCKYSIKATSFAGIYVDGNRERKPYEADAYINQLGHYSVDTNYTTARHTIEYFLASPTWPTEWVMQLIFMAHTDFMYTADRDYLGRIYQQLHSRTLLSLARSDALISTQSSQSTAFLKTLGKNASTLQDIVDWPPSERADYDYRTIGKWENITSTAEFHARRLRALMAKSMGFHIAAGLYEKEAAQFLQKQKKLPEVNTVVNAFHYQALLKMAELASYLGHKRDTVFFRERADLVKRSIQEKLIDKSTGLFIDSLDSKHSSFHANTFGLAFNLTPESSKKTVVSFLGKQGMACSVYCAQHLIDGLFSHGENELAWKLLTSKSPRSWAHMIYDLDASITLEAWDPKIKQDMDWNHAWGSAPANLIPRHIVGIQPIKPGFRVFSIAPHPGKLTSFDMQSPTIHGPIIVKMKKTGQGIQYAIKVPQGTSAEVQLPTGGGAEIKINGHTFKKIKSGTTSFQETLHTGKHRIIIIKNSGVLRPDPATA